MKPLTELSDKKLSERRLALARNGYWSGGRREILSDVADALSEVTIECVRRGLKCGHSTFSRKHDLSPIWHSKAIIRYAESRFLSSLMNGVISFAPARSYKGDVSTARRDDELHVIMQHRNTSVSIAGEDVRLSNIEIKRSMADEERRHFKYHFLSTSYEQSSKLRRAFKADGFVVITDASLFAHLIDDAVRGNYPDAEFCYDDVKYYDDLGEKSPLGLDGIMFWKTIQFKYQREHRLVLLGAKDTKNRVEVQISPPKGLFELHRTI